MSTNEGDFCGGTVRSAGRGSVRWDGIDTQPVGELITRKDTLDMATRILERAEEERRPKRTCRWSDDGHSIQTECGNAERSMGRWLWCPYCCGRIVTNEHDRGKDTETHPIGTVELLKAEIARLKAALDEAKWLVENNPQDGPDNCGWVERYQKWLNPTHDKALEEVKVEIARLEAAIGEAVNIMQQAGMSLQWQRIADVWLSTPEAERGKARADELIAVRALNESLNEQNTSLAVEITRLKAERDRAFSASLQTSQDSSQGNILPSGGSLLDVSKDIWGRAGQFTTPPEVYTYLQVAIVEAVCRWIEYPPRVMAAGTMVSVLRADAQARVDEARKEAKG